MYIYIVSKHLFIKLFEDSAIIREVEMPIKTILLECN